MQETGYFGRNGQLFFYIHIKNEISYLHYVTKVLVEGMYCFRIFIVIITGIQLTYMSDCQCCEVCEKVNIATYDNCNMLVCS